MKTVRWAFEPFDHLSWPHCDAFSHLFSQTANVRGLARSDGGWGLGDGY